MKKKGFTLIELLAVIVILAVIALIATPLIMNVINDAKKNSFKDSAYGIMKAVELRAMKEMQNAEGSNPPYKVDVTGKGITYSGERPTSGWAYVDVNGDIKLYMKNDAYCAYKEANSQEVTITTTPGDCDSEIGTISSSSATELGELTGPVVPPTPEEDWNYIVNESHIEIGQEVPEGVNVRTTAADAITDWEAISVDAVTRPFYTKHAIENGIVKDSYIEFIINDQLKAQWKAEYCADEFLINDETIEEQRVECQAAYDNLINGTYTLRGGVDEYDLESTPIYDANKSVLQSINYPSCVDNGSGEFSCGLSGLSIDVDKNGNTMIRDLGGYCEHFHLCEIYGGVISCYSGEGC